MVQSSRSGLWAFWKGAGREEVEDDREEGKGEEEDPEWTGQE